jgi:ABC-type thiamin/hydroxymethylpyrimidine transport system permease subunit
MCPRIISGVIKGFGSELYLVLLRHNESNQIVGMGRVVGDGGIVFYICDMAVE